MNHEWFVQIGDRVYGPHSPDKLRKGVETGKLTPVTLVRQGELGEWLQASEIKWLFNRETADHLVTEPTDATHGGPAVETPSEQEWHYIAGDEETGPVTFSSLVELVEDRVVTPDTMVWHDELEDWIEASELPKLRTLFQSAGGDVQPEIEQDSPKKPRKGNLLARIPRRPIQRFPSSWITPRKPTAPDSRNILPLTFIMNLARQLSRHFRRVKSLSTWCLLIACR